MDYRAARQRFITDRDYLTAHVPLDSSNPIDVILRTKAMELEPKLNFFADFHNKWIVVKTYQGLRIGRIKDMFFDDRLVRAKTSKGLDIIASFDDVLTLSERQP